MIILFIRMFFNKAENGDKFPVEWNLSYISFIFKKGDKRSTNDYTGICVMPLIARMYFIVIKDKKEHLDSCSEEKSGFQKARAWLYNICIMVSFGSNA